MDDLQQKNELIQAMTAIELSVDTVKTELAGRTYNKLPLSRLTALGTGFEPFAATLQQVTGKGEAVSGYYKVTIPKGTHLGKFKDGSGFFGAAMGEREKIAAQAKLNPLVCNPTILFAAATLVHIDKKLDSIQETQQEILDFLIQREKSALKGDLNFLVDVFNNYKHNWNNEKYKAANHIKVLDIRQNAGRMIDFYQERIKKRMEKKTFLHSNQDVKKQLIQVQDEFKEYQMALYLYAFAYFLEVLLQENFDSVYLNTITKKMDDMAFQYRELYTTVYTKIEGLAKSSLQSKVFDGLSVVNKTAGEAIGKLPVIKKTQLDETLIGAGKKIDSYKEKRVETTMQQLLDRQSSGIRLFIDNINTMNRLYNNSLILIFNNDTLYLDSV